jgi:xylan 1,4-beta-xylosidase
MRYALLFLLYLLPLLAAGQTPISITVNASQRLGLTSRAWAYFGYDEPNYTYTKNGRKLIGELAALSDRPVHIRTHFLLATGDGTAGLKWGSTNAYSEDAAGKPVYDWTIVDRILATYAEAGAVPFVEIGFMPKALSTHPDPYTPTWVPGAKNDGYYIGWTYPPSDYGKWGELVYQWVQHSVNKYGKAVVEQWDWEVWNEPDIAYWHGTPEEYDKLYDYTAAAVKRALPSARVGGPASTGPANARAAEFLHQFLSHCATGRNYATGRKGAPLDFISFHVKGKPSVEGDHVRMGISQEMKDAARGFEIVASFPNFKHLPLILSEADPEGCAACSTREYPQNAYRNGTLYASYEAAAFKSLLTLAVVHGVQLQGVLTWAFEFEERPYFAGFRTLATNGVDKPVLNFFRMAGLMLADSLKVDSSGAVAAEAMLQSGVRAPSDIDAIASRSDRGVSVMIWNYRDQEVGGATKNVELNVSGLPPEARRVLSRHYRIDGDHSNAYSLWKQMGSPQTPDAGQYAKLEAAGQLQLLDSPRWMDSESGSTAITLSIPSQAISLVELSW